MRNYNAAGRIFLAHAPSFVTAIAAIAAQVFMPYFPQQKPHWVDSFFSHVFISQFVHLSWTHLSLNLLGLGLVSWGFSSVRSQRELLVFQLAGLLWVPFYLSLLERVDWYCGLSGALHFQFAVCWVVAWQQTPKTLRHNWPLCILGLGLVIKLVQEWNASHIADAVIGGPIAYEAHRGGAIGGFMVGILLAYVFADKLRCLK